MRATIHLVSAGDYPLFAEAIRRTRREWWSRVQRRGAEEIDWKRVAALVRRHLAEGPRRQAELAGLLQSGGFPRMAWAGAGMWVDMVRVPPSGTWEQRRADLYALADGSLGPSSATEAEGLDHLVRRYLGGFGPASLNDVANFAGLAVTTLRPVVERLRLRRFRDEEGGELLDVPRAPLPDADTPAPVRFLPTWDATLLVHARRTQILPETYRPRSSTRRHRTPSPRSSSTARWPARGAMSAGGCGWSRSDALRRRLGESWRARPSASPHSTPTSAGYTARIRLFLGWCSTSARPRTSITGGT
jgi:hypothetical protein